MGEGRDKTLEEVIEENRRLKALLPSLLQSRLIEEAEVSERRGQYEGQTPDDAMDYLIRVDPAKYNYTSEDFWMLGKFKLRDLYSLHGDLIFTHNKTKTKPKFMHSLLATFLQVNYKIVTIEPTGANTRDKGDMYFYDANMQKMYLDTAETHFGEVIKRMFGDGFKTNMLNETFANIKLSSYIDREDFALEPMLIPVKNGLIQLTQNSEAQCELIENSPEYYVSSRIPVIYDPEADCPRFKQFLEEILPGQPDERKWIQQYLGYCLYRKWPYDKVMMLLGEGDNGKSTMLRLFRSLLGQVNCTTVGIFQMCTGRWYTAELYKKLANIDADTSTLDLKNTSNFKTATGGDTIMGERKFKDPFYFDSFCKHWMSANTIPYCYDDTNAFYRRWFIIQFRESFPLGDPRRDEGLLDKLLEELPGLLNWALEGLRELLENGFKNPPNTSQNKVMWNQLSNPVYAFIYSENVVIDKDGYYEKQKFYDDFMEYCKAFELPQWTKDKIGKRINMHFDFIRDSYPYNTEEQKQYHAWAGIRPATSGDKSTHDKALEEAIIITIQVETEHENSLRVLELEKSLRQIIAGGDSKFKDLFGINAVLDRLDMMNVIMRLDNMRVIRRGMQWNTYLKSGEWWKR